MWRAERQQLLIAVLVVSCFIWGSHDAAAQPNRAALQCVGATGQVCGKTCQLHLCKQLHTVYNVSNNATDPWDREDGWQLTASMPCEKLVAAASPRRAVYCSWFGVTCCDSRGLAQGNCSMINAVSAIEMPLNNMNVSVSNPVFLQAIQHLHGCGLTSLSLEANQLSGAMGQGWGTLVNLKVLDLGNAWIEGTIPSALRRLKNLTYINLSNNFLGGTLPGWLDELEQLEVLNLGSQAGINAEAGLHGTIPSQIGNLRRLRQLNLEANWLSGELPEELCHGGANSTLIQLNLRANVLEGEVRVVEKCGQLLQLDISDNEFEGPLPWSPTWSTLTTYQASNNGFSGAFPYNLCMHATILETLDISRNELTGAIPNQIGLLSSLKTINLGYNQFTGTITEDVYYLPALRHIDISNNHFVGTIPANAIAFPFGLLDTDFSNNTGMTGVIPPQMGFLLNLQKARFTGTSMSCAGIIKPYTITTNASCSDPTLCTTPETISSNDTQPRMCTDEEVLPCFLRFSSEALPRDDASNMRCRYIIRKPPDQAKEDCAAASGVYGLGDEAQTLPDIVADSTMQSWVADPSYYQYKDCSCLTGFGERWDSSWTVLTCVELPGADRKTVIIVACISAVAGLALLGVALLVAQLYLRTRPRWLRERIMQKKRTQGAPCCLKPGEKVPVSIVVTDIKDFSALTRKHPEAMIRAMGVHNNILRKACHTHAGYVLDQEGDSWTVAFSDAEDAVAFGLQVQQALSRKAWALRLPPEDHPFDLGQHMASLRHDTLSGFSLQASTLWRNGSNGKTASTLAAPANSTTGAGSGSAAQLAAGTTSSGVGGLHRGGSSASSRSGSEQQMHASAAGRKGPGGALARLFGSSRGRDSAAEPPATRLSASGDSDTGPVRDDDSSAEEATASNQQLPQINCSNGPPTPAAEGVPDSGPLAAVASPSACSKSSVASFGSLVAESVQDAALGSTTRQSSTADSSGSKMRGVSGLMQRIARQVTSRSSGVSGQLLGNPTGRQQQQLLQVLRLAVRIGIASGPLPYGCDASSCAVNYRAKALVSDVANGGQVLLDEGTFLLIKDSLSVLGTVNEGGYDDNMLQQLMHAKVVGKLQQQVACTCSSASRELSFVGGLFEREAQDYDNDAIVVHMGCFDVPDAPMDVPGFPAAAAAGRQGSYCKPDVSGLGLKHAPDGPEGPSGRNGRSPDGPSAGPDSQAGPDLELLVTGRVRSRTLQRNVQQQRQQLHLYSIAAPGMRCQPKSTQDLSRLMGWADPVNIKPGWVEVQKGYFSAPGARQMDLTPSSQLMGQSQAPLPDVTVVFVSVEGGSAFTAQHSRSEVHAVHKAVIKCMQQQLDALPGRDGYLCKAQEADLKYMLAFEQPHNAVQWCLLVQEALMYVDWGQRVLSHPGFEQVLSPATGLPLFRGPRLRMGLAEGQPNSVIPDHAGRANYYGGSVNRAARFMDAAAHGGQVVTNMELTRKLFMDWIAQDREGVGICLGARLDSADGSLFGQDGAGEATLLPLLEQPDQQQQQLGLRSAVPTIAEGQPLPARQRTNNNLQQQQAGGQQLYDPSLLTLVGRSSSDTAARYRRSSWGGRPSWHLSSYSRREGDNSAVSAASLGLAARSRSYTAAGSNSSRLADTLPPQSALVIPRNAQQQQQQDCEHQMAGATGAAAGAADAVFALHLGKYSFKGSGEYEMVQVLHAGLIARLDRFPPEPPKGKGERLAGDSVLSGPVMDLPEVRLHVGPALMAARQAFLPEPGV